MQPEPADFDNTWKDILDEFLPLFMKLFFPAVYQDIDWDRKYESLEQELRRILPEAEVGKRFVDKLIKVYRKNGDEVCVYIHIEVQSQPDKDMPKRVYIYNSILFIRYQKPIMSLVVLGNDNPNWKPGCFEYEIWGSRVRLDFQSIKLLDYSGREAELYQSGNPFAIFVIAHLKTLETKSNPNLRLDYKEQIVKELLEQGLSNQEIYLFFKFVDTMMALPKELELVFLDNIHAYQEEKKMPTIAPFEQIAMEKGREKGKAEGREEGREEGRAEGNLIEAQATLIDILEALFGELPSSLIEAIHHLEDISLLRRLRRQVLTMKSLAEFERVLQESNNGRI